MTSTTFNIETQPWEENEIVNVGYCPTNCDSATGYWDVESNDGVTYTFDANGEVKIGPGKYDLELDPNNQNCQRYQRLPVFSVCKNNCPGGKNFVYFIKVVSFINNFSKFSRGVWRFCSRYRLIVDSSCFIGFRRRVAW